MGSRLNISLQQLLGHPNIEVRLFCEEHKDDETQGGGTTRIEYAEVKVKSSNEVVYPDFKFIFDSHTYKGETTLSCDWNWFWYPNDPDHYSRKIMHMLYEYSVSFTVHH